MVQFRIPSLVLVSSLFGAAALGMLAPSVAHAGDDAKPCKATSFTYQAVKDACAKGGQKEAKKLMGATLKKAKEKNPEWKCSHCHKEGGFDLLDNAVKDLEPFIGAKAK